ncbi:PIN domain-containing protein [Phreatobacter oligotrophus]|uniref:PIN domain-containing protein n=1 Tax=Phreatobacter oligotrophus TaxID=1122261 RepID=UPI00235800AC|nr:PIN domain-containing protein [Phreatobacter oligotrophus]MBX9989222.1 PIN domain-containing protein [Phreatobacter oligotrophus]
MTGYLLDTDICVHILRRKSVSARERLDHAAGDLFMSTVTLAELIFGGLKSHRPDRAAQEIEALAGRMTILAFDAAAASAYAAIRLDLERAGTPIGPNDMLIAAQAQSAGLIMVTGNRREFDRVPGLTVETWLV